MNAPLVIPKFIPVPNGKECREKQRKAAAEFRAVLLDLMTENGPLGSAQLAEMGGAKVSTVRDHLDYLMAHGIVKSEKVKGRNHPTGGTVMCLYSMAGEEAEPEPVVQRVFTEYPPNKVRDPYALPQNFFSRTTA